MTNCRRPRRRLAEAHGEFRSYCLVIKPIFPPELDEVRNITLRRQLGKANNADLAGNAIECSADDLLVLLPLLVIVAENEDAPVLEVWR